MSIPELEVDAVLGPEMDADVTAETILRAARNLPDDDQPTTPAPPTDAKPEPTVSSGPKPSKVNLDDIEDFRKFRSERDKKEDAYKKRIEAMERQLAERQAAEEQLRMTQLRTRLTETDDDSERTRAIEEMAAIRGQSYAQAERAWAKHVATRVNDAGLDPDDFEPTRYRGQEGATQFERDVAQAAMEKLKKELLEARKAAAPDAVANIVKQELAKALRDRGVDASVDTSAPTSAGDPTANKARDQRLLQTGRLAPEIYHKRYG
jgi:hypothetical protein